MGDEDISFLTGFLEVARTLPFSVADREKFELFQDAVNTFIPIYVSRQHEALLRQKVPLLRQNWRGLAFSMAMLFSKSISEPSLCAFLIDFLEK